MYGKLINTTLFIAPNKLNEGNTIVFNPPHELYIDQGWKPVIFTDMPEPPTGYTYEMGWSEINGIITEIWTLVELSDDIDDSEVIEILLGGIK